MAHCTKGKFGEIIDVQENRNQFAFVVNAI